MTEKFVTRGFVGRRGGAPVRSTPAATGPVPDQRLSGALGRSDAAHAARPVVVHDRRPGARSRSPGLAGLHRAAGQDFTVDISCVTKWTHLDMRWHGVTHRHPAGARPARPEGCLRDRVHDGGYTTNLPIAEILNGQRSSPGTTTARRSRRRTAGRRGWSSRTSTSGRAPSGSAASGSWSTTSPASGNGFGYNNHGDPGKKSATRATEGVPRPSPGSSHRSPRFGPRRQPSRRSVFSLPAGSRIWPASTSICG